MVKLNKELVLELILAYKNRPGHKNSWPSVEEDIKRFAKQNKDKMPEEVYLSIYQFSDKVLYNFANRGTPLKPRVIDLLHSFFHSEMFLSQVPYARDIIQKRKRSIESGRALSEFVGVSWPDLNNIFSAITGYWISMPMYLEDVSKKFGKEKSPFLNEEKKGYDNLIFREVLYINQPFNEPFAFLHCYRQTIAGVMLNHERSRSDLDPDFTHWRLSEESHLGVLSGFIFKDDVTAQFSTYLYSRFSGKFAFEFVINTDQKEKVLFDTKVHRRVPAIKLSNYSGYHPSVAGLGKVLGESYIGPLTHDQFFHYAAYSTRGINDVFEKIKESVISDE